MNILKNKIFLYATEFFAGMSVMAVELGASRLLAPYFSSSQIVWTIIIGTIMIAMALGNLWGGKTADKNPSPDRLYMRLIVAAVWIALIPLVGKYVIVGISALTALVVSGGFLIVASLISCLVLFVFPLLLLGTVTPSLVKYTVDSLDDSGKVVGRLNALNTVGSIIGTFTPTFITIPAVGTSVTFLIFAGILLLLGLVYFISCRAKPVQCAVAVVIFILSCVFGSSSDFAFWNKTLIYEGESIYNYLQVSEDDNSVMLSTNVLIGVQSVKMKNGALTGSYYDYACLAPLMAGIDEKSDADILILGLGAGTYAGQCKKYFPRANVSGVEIDEKIVDIAYKYFDLPEETDAVVGDGRAYLTASDKKYDVIMVDAYQDITIPFQMSSVEFFTEVKNHLREDGVLVVNMNMKVDTDGSINDWLCDTIASVFPSVYTVRTGNGTNMELFASFDGDTMMNNCLSGIASCTDYQFQAVMSNSAKSLASYQGGKLILTDDKAPVELLGIRAIDAIISDELKYYKGILREKGISGLIDMFG